MISFLCGLLDLVTAVLADPSTSLGHQNALKACREIQRHNSAIVHFPGSAEYLDDIEHYEQTSAQNSTCGVTPRSVEDVQMVLGIIGRKDILSPFAIKSGGHAFNPGFSSSPGVQIALRSLQTFHYDANAQTVELGSGWTWDEVYEQLDSYGVTVIGGRIPGVGMGVLYGGGYSWYTNQHGLACDNALAYGLVLPNGTFVNVTQETQPELFFGLKGGLNNFGIITSATVKAWPIGQVWAGSVEYSMDHNEEIMKAVEDFSVNNRDEKAQLEAIYIIGADRAYWNFLFFYDAPTPSPAPFKDLLSIPSVANTTKITTHTQFVKESTYPSGVGSFLDTVPIIHYTYPVLKAGQASINATMAKAVRDGRSARTLYFLAEPFYNHFAHTNGPSAYPHSSSNPTTPSGLWFDYTDPEDLEYFHEALKKSTEELQKVVVKEGQGKRDDVKYGNYALSGTTVEQVFGESLGRMKKLKEAVDPTKVMALQGEGFLI